MQVKYRVAGVHEHKATVEAEFNGRKVPGEVPALTVELVSDDERHGHTFRFVPADDADMSAHREMFVVGTNVVASFRKEEAA